ncbi:diguanylate cyclase domain-containing protein [Sulfurimonas sp.]
MLKLDIILLYVEDDNDIAVEVMDFLKHRVRELHFAKNGEEGLDIYKHSHPDMIITDIQMPVMNGLDMIQRIREDNNEIPIIITSAHNDCHFLLESINMGVDGYLLKPLDLEQMIAKIHKLAEPMNMKKHIRQLNNKLIKTNANLEAKIAKAVQAHTDSLIKENETMQKLAFYDSLTTLPNRAFIYEVLERKIQRAKRNNDIFALFFIDADNFKQINDSYGHNTGDDVLKEFALRLQQSIRKSDYVGRLGGDEFILIAEDVENTQAVITLAEKICEQINQPFQINDTYVDISCSIGISCFPEDAEDMSELIKDADMAMYSVKKKNKDGVAFYRDMKEN